MYFYIRKPAVAEILQLTTALGHYSLGAIHFGPLIPPGGGGYIRWGGGREHFRMLLNSRE